VLFRSIHVVHHYFENKNARTPYVVQFHAILRVER